jgi:spermidine synthase
MIPWEELDRAVVPGEEVPLRLMRRGQEISIRLGTSELMNSRQHGSEEALATLVCERLKDVEAPRILIGGLGLGYTLRAALAVLGPKASVTVSELVPAVVAWARGPIATLHEGSLDDPRVRIRETDVALVMGEERSWWDAILLDVDNGPEAMTQAANDGLYGMTGLADARKALRPRGILAVWSQGPDSAFSSRLRRAGFVADEVTVRARGKSGGSRHRIWLATTR